MSLTQENILQIEDREGRRRTDLRRQHNYRLQGGSSSLAERIRALELKDSLLDQKELETIKKCVKLASFIKDKKRKKYQKELKKMEKAKNLSVFEFVSISCHTLHAILSLNFQSICRFKESKQFIKLTKAVNLEQLLDKYKQKEATEPGFT